MAFVQQRYELFTVSVQTDCTYITARLYLRTTPDRRRFLQNHDPKVAILTTPCLGQSSRHPLRLLLLPLESRIARDRFPLHAPRPSSTSKCAATMSSQGGGGGGGEQQSESSRGVLAKTRDREREREREKREREREKARALWLTYFPNTRNSQHRFAECPAASPSQEAAGGGAQPPGRLDPTALRRPGQVPSVHELHPGRQVARPRGYVSISTRPTVVPAREGGEGGEEEEGECAKTTTTMTCVG